MSKREACPADLPPAKKRCLPPAKKPCITTKIKGRRFGVPGKSFTLKVEKKDDSSWREVKPRVSTRNGIPSWIYDQGYYTMDYQIGHDHFVYVVRDINTTLRLTEHDIGVSNAHDAEIFAQTLRERFGPLVKVQLQMRIDYDEYDGVSEYSDCEDDDDE